MNNSEKEKKNQEYLNKVLSSDSDNKPKPIERVNTQKPKGENSIEYTNISLNILPCGKFYKPGTKISIRAAKVSEIQAYSMVDDNNYVDITEKMNELLSRCVLYTRPDGSKGSYRDIKDSDRVFIIFMIRELTFQGGNTLTKSVTCQSCGHDFSIPFRSTPNDNSPSTFEFYEPSELISDFYNKDLKVYELLYEDVSWKLSPPTIGIQEDFYEEIKRNVGENKKPEIAFMKIMPYLLYERDSIDEKEIKSKLKEFKNMDDIILFQGLNEIVNNMTVGIKGLKMTCPSCGQEVHTEISFPGGASTLFQIPDIFSRFRK